MGLGERKFHITGHEDYEFDEIQGVHPKCPFCAQPQREPIGVKRSGLYLNPFFGSRGPETYVDWPCTGGMGDVHCEYCGRRFRFKVIVVGQTTPLGKEFWKFILLMVFCWAVWIWMIFLACVAAREVFNAARGWLQR